MKQRNIPQVVLEAQLAGDKKTLSRLGKKGGGEEKTKLGTTQRNKRSSPIRGG